MKKKRILIPLVLLVLLVLAFLLYTGIYYRADGEALAALASDESVRVEQTDYGWFFDGPSADTALIFYPGGKVEETAYARFLHRLASEGVDVFLLRAPFRLAFFVQNEAGELMSRYGYERWYLGGHSLGGAVAALYASGHGEGLDGLILCAAYPTRPLDAHGDPASRLGGRGRQQGQGRGRPLICAAGLRRGDHRGRQSRAVRRLRPAARRRDGPDRRGGAAGGSRARHHGDAVSRKMKTEL